MQHRLVWDPSRPRTLRGIPMVWHATLSKDGPSRTLAIGSRCCGAARQSRHSLQLHLPSHGELTNRGTKRSFAASAPMAASESLVERPNGSSLTTSPNVEPSLLPCAVTLPRHLPQASPRGVHPCRRRRSHALSQIAHRRVAWLGPVFPHHHRPRQ